MDELIEYLANTPENTNFNIVREMLGNMGGSIDSESNFKIVKTPELLSIEAPRILIYIPYGNEHNFRLINAYLIQPLTEGIIDNNFLAGTYLYNNYLDCLITLETTQLNQEPDSIIQSDKEYINTHIEEMDSGHYRVYASNKTQNIYISQDMFYITEEELENNFTFIGEYEKSEGEVS